MINAVRGSYHRPEPRVYVSTRPTDAVSAALAAFAVWIAGRADGRRPRELLRPAPFALGILAAVAVEAGIARWPARARRLWRQPVIRFGSPVCLVGGALAAERRFGAAPFAATLGGLAGYFSLLAGVVSGIVPEPATWFGGTRRGD